RKWPVNAARAAGEVNTVVWGVELLATADSDWSPRAETLTDWVTGGMATGTDPDGALIDSLAEVVAWTVWPVDAAVSAEKCEVNDPEVTTSTSVKVPIVALKYRRAWSLRAGFASRSGNVSVWAMVAEAGGPPVRSRRPSRGRTAGVSPRRGR